MTLVHTACTNAIHSGLDECVDVAQGFIIGHSKSKMCLEELIKGCDAGLHRTGNNLLVQENVEILNAVVSFSDMEEKGLSKECTIIFVFICTINSNEGKVAPVYGPLMSENQYRPLKIILIQF